MTTEPIRVMIVDDHGMVRFGLRGYIETIPSMSVVGEAGSGEEAIELLKTLDVDIVLMDLVLPGMSGAQAIQHMRDCFPRVRVIVIGICAVRRASVVTIQLHSLRTRTHADTPIAVNASADDGSLVDE